MEEVEVWDRAQEEGKKLEKDVDREAGDSDTWEVLLQQVQPETVYVRNVGTLNHIRRAFHARGSNARSAAR